ncbi:MAG: UDP-N-acetylmuramoyl-L-alanine--D-glutamate ligase [Chlamydiae bacterium CG10_big_fil_rev_8_21_14_0_10_42_34]|nr:MAG: UDP-N-acetylmuramoyl-L-alanine--D-glutamate ligase [Chlamydiae bacterium CG10_big_fil_rev_8_21_14_0_10_42_34]
MKVLVMGYGVSGKAAESFLKAQGCDVTVVDRNAEGALSDRPDFPLGCFDQVVLSPGIAPTHPLVQKAQEMGIEVIGEIELGFRNLKNRSFGITGANGKTTTVLMTTHILNSSGKKAKALGNVGEPLTKYLLRADPEEILVIELSSFQLETLKSKQLEVGLVLNITPNHLDRYRSMQEYVEAKALIARCLKERGELFISSQVHEEFGSFFQGAKNFEVDLLNDFGYMQLEMASKQSAQAAYLLCKRCGVTDVEFLEGLKTFKKPPHRIEWVAEIDGVSYHNDSKASNIHSVIHAVRQFEGPIVLIIGGLHKGSSYRPWIECFEGKVRKIIAYGQAAPIMEYELAPLFDFQLVGQFADAVRCAKTEAKKGETVLLSPGCSSYDQFKNYEQRGEEFKRLVREL